MSISYAERRQIENEMIFRRMNEKVANELDKLEAKLIEDGNADLILDDDQKLHFNCECSDEDCIVRIPMLLKEYEDIHTDRSTFVVLPNHQVDLIEIVLRKTTGYSVVKKNQSISEPSDELNTTSIHNV